MALSGGHSSGAFGGRAARVRHLAGFLGGFLDPWTTGHDQYMRSLQEEGPVVEELEWGRGEDDGNGPVPSDAVGKGIESCEYSSRQLG